VYVVSQNVENGLTAVFTAINHDCYNRHCLGDSFLRLKQPTKKPENRRKYGTSDPTGGFPARASGCQQKEHQPTLIASTRSLFEGIVACAGDLATMRAVE